MNDLSSLCKKAQALGFYGSYTRKEDYVEDLSDINVFALSDDKSILLDLASLGYSPVVISSKYFEEICMKGDPLCHYIYYDSDLICGEFPAVKPSINEYTCKRFANMSISSIQLSREAFLRQDEKGSLTWTFRSIRSLIQYISCLGGSIPFSNSQIKEKCLSLGKEVCETLYIIQEKRERLEAISASLILKVEKLVKSVIKETV
ncbi:MULTISPECIES: hypothetical protein [Acidianus]|uniref:Nucleotidyltransferase n=1 Tax=Candidatus Acidianus copahuensis TaxID=1160895 RepID=A0A031LIF8_9CREN|nr:MULTISPECIES: hypothetical protein [Acidianus]EZQ01907.1 hypothetical protein CM19_11805 [Candidatus Acidianus copahuensis]NON63505.1 hypothetical protein [Acidianus sp. RZ1]